MFIKFEAWLYQLRRDNIFDKFFNFDKISKNWIKLLY